MALVVTARSNRDAQRSPSALRGPEGGYPAALQRIALGSAMWALVVFVALQAARLSVPPAWLGDAAQAATLTLLALALVLAALGWTFGRDDPLMLFAATLAPLVIAIQLLLPFVLRALDQPTMAYIVDAGLGLLALLLLVTLATQASVAQPGGHAASSVGLFGVVTHVITGLAFVVALSGATVRATGASWACRGFPDCNGLGMLPFGRDPLTDVNLYHRLVSYALLALVVWVAVEAFRTFQRGSAVRSGALLLAGATIAQAAGGAVAVAGGMPAVAQALHASGAAVTLCVSAALSVLVQRGPPAAAPGQVQSRGWATTLTAYIQLTKPRVMSLLLATTAAAMVIAARGMPPLGVFVATLIGGALMSGGAGAINHYVDRDIDPLMGRTAWRPIPSGVISPRHALQFGIGLAVIATAVFLLLVNALAAIFAMLGLLGYVFIYTLWLKRSTPSNIVIGGAAGAIPPLVGWAAVTNELSSLTAWYLFAIIFFWTPPHFWALSLLIRQHYERAGVPMLPVVRGEDETRRQILLYALLLVALTLVLSPFGMMGLVYFVAALALGGTFVAFAFRLWRQATREAARRLYLFSLLYLFALFTAMALDRVVS